MKILAADSSTSILAVAICEDSHVLAETIVDCGRTHTERLIGTVDWVMRESGLSQSDLDALAITVGPGSFTGVRVGASAWKGLALALGLPLIPVPTLDAMTRLSVFRDTVVCPLLDARMGEVYGAVYEFSGTTRMKRTPDMVCPVEKLLEGLPGKAFFFGDGLKLYGDRIRALIPDAQFLPSHCSVPRGAAVAAEAVELLASGICTDPARVVPVYLRQSQAEQNRERNKAVSA